MDRDGVQWLCWDQDGGAPAMQWQVNLFDFLINRIGLPHGTAAEDLQWNTPMLLCTGKSQGWSYTGRRWALWSIATHPSSTPADRHWINSPCWVDWLGEIRKSSDHTDRPIWTRTGQAVIDSSGPTGSTPTYAMWNGQSGGVHTQMDIGWYAQMDRDTDIYSDNRGTKCAITTSETTMTHRDWDMGQHHLDWGPVWAQHSTCQWSDIRGTRIPIGIDTYQEHLHRS